MTSSLQVDEFIVEAADLGNLERVTVRQDFSGTKSSTADPGWFLDTIVVRNPVTGVETFFNYFGCSLLDSSQYYVYHRLSQSFMNVLLQVARQAARSGFAGGRVVCVGRVGGQPRHVPLRALVCVPVQSHESQPRRLDAPRQTLSSAAILLQTALAAVARQGDRARTSVVCQWLATAQTSL